LNESKKYQRRAHKLFSDVHLAGLVNPEFKESAALLLKQVECLLESTGLDRVQKKLARQTLLRVVNDVRYHWEGVKRRNGCNPFKNFCNRWKVKNYVIRL